MSWSLFPTISAPMPFQMALDEILFREYDSNLAPVLRFYLSSEPWISIGYSQRIESNGERVCRRITGGGRVEHGKDLIFSLIAAKNADDSFKSVRTAYWKIHEAVKAGFEILGLNLTFYRCDEELPRGADCFLFPIATDLALDGKKIAGGAQKRSSGVLLHQESVQLPRSVDWRTLQHALEDGFRKVFGIELVAQSLTPELLKRCVIPAKAGINDMKGL